MFTAQRRSASARALQDVILYGLHRGEFMRVCENFPYAYERMHAKAMEQLAKTRSDNDTKEVRAGPDDAPRATAGPPPSASARPCPRAPLPLSLPSRAPAVCRGCISGQSDYGMVSRR
eukprot:6305505-Prymnesium_polylepis.1